MKKVAFIFAGQGSQYVGMGKEFYDSFQEARDIYAQAKIDIDVKSICFNGEAEQLNETSFAQPCILTTSLAIAKVVEAQGIKPAYVAGLSLGEYSALAYANAMSPSDAIEIIRQRGKIMASALPVGTTSMAAVLAMDAEAILAVIKDIDGVSIANYNCPGQIVITGTEEAVVNASTKLSEAGAKRVIPLNVSGAFHSPLLEDASYELKAVLEKYVLKTPTIPVVYNITGKEEDRNLVDILTQQIKSSVYFYQSLQYMVEHGVEAFIEIGPGKALSAFVKKTTKEVPVYSVDSIEGLNKMLGALNDE